VYVLDPCCGTGTFLAAVLKRIDMTLAESGFGALRGQMVKKAATTRIFGFEILPAPFVVAHLQVGLVLQALGAGLQADNERAGVYLTNALTGWEPIVAKPLPFPELEEERKKADKVKQEEPILVIIGNPPYNGYAGMAVDEERALTGAYRTTKKVRRPEGHGLNDLYIRFFRMAERRIAEKTGIGIVCFISNYGWLDGLSFTGMRERYLEAFDAIRVDCLNGDKYRTGKTTPEGLPDPSIFSTEHNREGIQVGTAITCLIRKQKHEAAPFVYIRHLWGSLKRQELLNTAEEAADELYKRVDPPLELGLPFVQAATSEDYYRWTKLPELFPISFPGVKTSRDDFLVTIDKEVLERRLDVYFDPAVGHDEIRARYPLVMTPTAHFDPARTRDGLCRRGKRPNCVARFAYRPFDIRWVYWEPETKLLDRNRPEYAAAFEAGTIQLVIPRAQRKEWSPPLVARSAIDINIMDGSASAIPARVKDPLQQNETRGNAISAVLSSDHQSSLKDATFLHCLAILHSPLYFTENNRAMRADAPRIPLPRSAERLRMSASLGGRLAVLLDPETNCAEVTVGKLGVALRTMGIPYKLGGKPFEDADLAVAAGWGYVQVSRTRSSLVMPGAGLIKERDCTKAECAALEEEAKRNGVSIDAIFYLLGARTCDVHLNADAMWTNVPAKV
jgi:predicted helicase